MHIAQKIWKTRQRCTAWFRLWCLLLLSLCKSNHSFTSTNLFQWTFVILAHQRSHLHSRSRTCLPLWRMGSFCPRDLGVLPSPLGPLGQLGAYLYPCSQQRRIFHRHQDKRSSNFLYIDPIISLPSNIYLLIHSYRKQRKALTLPVI